MKIHFIAIGGSIMHNLALTLQAKGDWVTGSDDAFYEPSKTRLKLAGILPEEMGWFPEKITAELDAVILGMHARKDNPELLRAQELGLKIYSFPQYMYNQSKSKKRMVIAGSHGKTTITSMILHVLHKCNISSDYLVGAQLEGFDRMVEINPDHTMAVFEGDEYLTSALDPSPKFSHYFPNVLVVSGIAWDHMNVFPTFESYVNPFKELISSLNKEAVLIYYKEDVILHELVQKYARCKVKPYHAPKYYLKENETVVDQEGEQYPLQIFGNHNLENTEAARLVCEQVGVASNQFYRSLHDFKGSAKRLEKIIEHNNFIFYRDFAHSPSKLKATIHAVKEQYPQKKLIACMELHTYSSLNKAFLPQYKGCMDEADEKIIFFDPEVVKLKKLPFIDGQDILEGFENNEIKIESKSEALKRRLQNISLNNTVLLMMSSGSFGGIDYNVFAKQLVGTKQNG